MKTWIVRDCSNHKRLGIIDATDALQACINFRRTNKLSYAIKLTASKYYANKPK